MSAPVAAASSPSPAGDEKKVVYAPGSAGTGNQKIIGLLGGIAWASSAEYYRFLNEEILRRLGKAHSARILMNSLDLQEYLEALNAKDYNKVRSLIGTGCARLQNGGADFIVLCSNTAHIGTDVIGRIASTTPLLHMADCVAASIKKAGYVRCGFIGTRFAMDNPEIQLARLAMHGLEVVVPASKSVRDRIWSIIEHELSLNKFTPESRAFLVGVCNQLVTEQKVQCIILGCTEIPLLVTPKDVPNVPLIDTTRIHATTAIDVSLGITEIDSLLPACLVVEKVEKKKKKPVAPATATTAATTATAPTAAPANKA